MYGRGGIPKQLTANRATSSTRCQKCLKTGHFTYECTNSRPYVPRPSRTKQLRTGAGLAPGGGRDQPSVELPDEFRSREGLADRILKAKEEERARLRERERRERERSERRRGRRDSRGERRGSEKREVAGEKRTRDSRSPRRRSDSDSESDAPARKRRYSSSSGSSFDSDSERSRGRSLTRTPPPRRRSASPSRSRAGSERPSRRYPSDDLSPSPGPRD